MLLLLPLPSRRLGSLCGKGHGHHSKASVAEPPPRILVWQAAKAVAAELGVGPVPEWVNAMAGAGATVEDAAGRVGQLVRTISRTISGRLVGTTAKEGETADAPPRRCCFVGSAPRRAAPAVSESATPEKEEAGV